MNTTFTTQNSSLLGKLSGALLKSIFISFILVLGTANAWAGEATIYVTGHIFKDSWDASKSEVRIGYNYNSNNGDQWTGHKSMTLTQYTYNGYPIYSYKVSSSTNWAKIFFYHYKDGQHFNSQQQDTGDWTEFTNNKNKVYVGWIDNAHRWVELCEENTFYFLKNGNAANWTNLYAYAWSGSINNNWPGTSMTNTGKTYNGTPIYSVKLYCTYATIIFNQGNGTDQSGDQATSGHEGKIFDYKNDKWLDYTYDVTVTFNANGHGTAPTAKTVLKGGKVSAPTAPTATGYTFGGWYKESNCTNAFDFNTAINADITLYAKWTPNTYTVTLRPVQGTGGTESVTATYGQPMPEITPHTREGYELQGYYTGAGGTGTKYYNADGSSAKDWDETEDYVLYAYWERIKHTVNYGTVGGNGTLTIYYGTSNTSVKGSNHSSDIAENTSISFTASPDYGYEVEGWYSDVSCDEEDKIQSAGTNTTYGSIVVIEEISVYVKFKEKNTYTVDVVSNNTTQGTVSPSSVVVGIINAQTITATPKSGYQFSHWEATDGILITDANSASTTILAEAAGTVTAYFEEDLSTDYVLRGGNAVGGNNWSTEIPLTRKAGVTNKAYVTIPINYLNTNGDGGDNDFNFKIVNKNTNTYYGIHTKDCSSNWWYKRTSGTQTMTGHSTDNDNVHLCADAIGNYVIEVDYSTTSIPQITITFPEKTSYLVGEFNDWTWSDEWAFDTEGKLTHHFDKSDSDYKFKILTCDGKYLTTSDANKRQFARQHNEEKLDTEGGTENELKLQADISGNYIFEFDASTKKLIVTHPDYIPEACYLLGIDDNWEERAGYKFTINGEIATLRISIGKDATHDFKIKYNGCWYGNKTFTQTATHEMDGTYGCANAKITTDALFTGEYIFIFNTSTKELTINYPLEEGDYVLVYSETDSDPHPSDIIKKNDTRTIYSLHIYNQVDGGTDGANNPQVMLKECTARNSNTITWETRSTCTVFDTSNGIDAIKNDTDNNGSGVWNFHVTRDENGDFTGLNLAATERYDGPYYIRTDAAAGGWNAYATYSNRMTYSSYADNYEDFDHYFCKWIETGNVKYTIANDYSYCLSDSLAKDDLTGNEGNLTAKANVRFGWDSETNELSRAYISGSTTISDRFLVLIGDEDLKDTEGNTFDISGLNENETNFADMGNWVYQVDVKANSQTNIKLTAKYNEKVQYFKGSESSTAKLLTSTDDTKDYKIRIVYNFKTNHLVAGWLADGNTSGELGANMIIIRENQDPATQIQFLDESSVRLADPTLSEVDTVFAVMSFTKDFVNGTAAPHARTHYWVSFPFDVKISDVFGFGEYGDQWILQLYDGEARAKYGLFSDSGSYWRYITNRNYVLQKGVGYVLTLNLNKMTEETVFLHTNVANLYFPSNGEVGSISWEESVTTTVQEYKCTINRGEGLDDRRTYDSNWNIIGVPGFADVENYPVVTGDVHFYYRYLPLTNTYIATDETADFQTMYSYMVQYAGELTWTTSVVEETPAQLAARRNAASTLPEKVSLRLEIAQGEEMADQTFVQLQQEGATAEFDMNLDLTKIINSGANIYTLAGTDRIQTAGNALPMEKITVPVGVKIDTAGEYTFRMPNGTEGMVVELIDYERDITTNLLLFDYTVTLPAGSNESRFALHIQPNKSGVTTGVEEAYPQPLPKGKGAKFLIDGKLMIRTSEGVIYDAQGHVVQ